MSALADRVQEHAYARRWWILTVLCFSLLVIVLDNTVLNVAIPTIAEDLHADSSQLQWIVDSLHARVRGAAAHVRAASATASGDAARSNSGS